MNCFDFGFAMNSASAAASCDGSCAARTTSANLIIAGIAAAVSVLFFLAILSLISIRLCVIALISALLITVVLVSVLSVYIFPRHRKR